MSSPEEKRKFLDEWADSPDADQAAEAYPDCGCEDAAPCDGGHGPIADDETLRYFVTSHSESYVKSKKPKLSPTIFARIFREGLSVVRIDKAQKAEVEATAAIQYENKVAYNGEYGGVLGVIDFKASQARRDSNDNSRLCCVLDTPIKPERLAHADLVSSLPKLGDEEKTSLKRILFNQIHVRSSYVPSVNIDDCELSKFLPEIVKSTLRNLV